MVRTSDLRNKVRARDPEGLGLVTGVGQGGVFGVSAFVTLRQPIAKERRFS